MFGGPQSFSAPASQSLTSFGGASPSSQLDAKKPKQEEKQQVLPVTIRAIETALSERSDSTAELRFHGVAEPSSLILVALVESVVRQTASLELSLNDGTGRIKARYFVSESLPEHLDRVQAGRYISVVGSVRNTPVVHLGLLCVRPVESADEVSYHLIECAHAALKLQRGGQDQQKSAQSWTPQAKLKRPDPADATITPAKESDSQATTMAVEPPAFFPAVTRETSAGVAVPLRDSLVKVFSREAQAKGDVGVSASELLSALAADKVSATEAQLRTCLVEMVDNGEAFNTLDDDHFAPL